MRNGLRVLFCVQPGTNSRWIFQDVITGFRRAGCEPLIFELGAIWQLYQSEGAAGERLKGPMSQIVVDFCRSNGVEAVIGMWANTLMTFVNPEVEGRTVTLFEAIGVPHLLYWLDAPHWAHDGKIRGALGTPLLQGTMLHHCINNEATAREMREVFKMTGVHALNYGVNEETFAPRTRTGEFDCVFSLGPGDAPPSQVALEELESTAPDFERVRRDTAERVGPQLDELGATSLALRSILREMLKLQISERDTPMLERLERLERSGGTLAEGSGLLRSDPRLYIAATDLLRSVERFERPFMLSYLSRHFNCAMFGGGNLEAWGCRARGLGFVPHEEQAAAYGRGAVGINAMRWQDDMGSNIKPLEISASGVSCVMAHRRGVEQLLEPGREIALFHTPTEGVRAIRQLLENPAQRGAMAMAARTRVCAEHTWTVRARAMAEFMGL